MKNLKLLAVAMIGLAANSMAAQLTPLGYSLGLPGDGQAQGGSFNYFDETGTQLTDGIFGIAPWYADLGNGPAYEWVGWANRGSVDINFHFGPSETITDLHVGTVQDNLGDVAWPSLITVSTSSDGTTYGPAVGTLVVPPSPANDNQHTILDINGLSITDPYVRVTLTQGGPWIFTDEVTFNGRQAVTNAPDGGSSALLLAAGVAAIGAIRRRMR